MLEKDLSPLGPIYAEIGLESADVVGGDPDGIFIYVEYSEDDDGSYSIFGSLFKDEGSSVRYYDMNDILFDLFKGAWRAQPEGKRWLIMEYDVKGRSFNVGLTYPEQVDPKMDSGERRQAALDKRYGDKPIIYPSIPDDFIELK